MGDMTLGLTSDNAGEADDVTSFSIAYAMGDLSLSATADDANGWDASASYGAGDISVSYATDENSEWHATGSYALGSGVSVSASTDHQNISIIGVGFTF